MVYVERERENKRERERKRENERERGKRLLEDFSIVMTMCVLTMCVFTRVSYDEPKGSVVRSRQRSSGNTMLLVKV